MNDSYKDIEEEVVGWKLEAMCRILVIPRKFAERANLMS